MIDQLASLSDDECLDLSSCSPVWPMALAEIEALAQLSAEQEALSFHWTVGNFCAERIFLLASGVIFDSDKMCVLAGRALDIMSMVLLETHLKRGNERHFVEAGCLLFENGFANRFLEATRGPEITFVMQ